MNKLINIYIYIYISNIWIIYKGIILNLMVKILNYDFKNIGSSPIGYS